MWIHAVIAGLITILCVMVGIAHNALMRLLASMDERIGRIESVLLHK